jgi:hypothetical protein
MPKPHPPYPSESGLIESPQGVLLEDLIDERAGGSVSLDAN